MLISKQNGEYCSNVCVRFGADILTPIIAAFLHSVLCLLVEYICIEISYMIRVLIIVYRFIIHQALSSLPSGHSVV